MKASGDAATTNNVMRQYNVRMVNLCYAGGGDALDCSGWVYKFNKDPPDFSLLFRKN